MLGCHSDVVIPFTTAIPAPAPASLREFAYAELEAATSGFSAESMISSEGAFGSVFRGLIGASQHIAVKVRPGVYWQRLPSCVRA